MLSTIIFILLLILAKQKWDVYRAKKKQLKEIKEQKAKAAAEKEKFANIKLPTNLVDDESIKEFPYEPKLDLCDYESLLWHLRKFSLDNPGIYVEANRREPWKNYISELKESNKLAVLDEKNITQSDIAKEEKFSNISDNFFVDQDGQLMSESDLSKVNFNSKREKDL